MKICFVVMAHHQPRMFRRLMDSIGSAGADVVVHIDKRADLAQFLMPDSPRLHLVKKRRRVHWGGWSQTRTLCEALEHAIAVSDADYFIFLAGTDFPIRRLELLSRLLEDLRPLNLLNFRPLVRGAWGYSRIRRYWLNDLKSSFISIRAPSDPQAGRLRRFMGNFIVEAEKRIKAHLPLRNTSWIDFYIGSNRWCLNRQTVRFVVDYYRSSASRDLRNFLRLSGSSDEIFFQTAIMASPHGAQCVGYDDVKEILDGRLPPVRSGKGVFLYVDWNSERENPAILDDRDFDALVQSGKPFACKFTDDRSMSLVDRIERELLAPEAPSGSGSPAAVGGLGVSGQNGPGQPGLRDHGSQARELEDGQEKTG